MKFNALADQPFELGACRLQFVKACGRRRRLDHLIDVERDAGLILDAKTFAQPSLGFEFVATPRCSITRSIGVKPHSRPKSSNADRQRRDVFLQIAL